ncbi:hypothetical protein ORI20_20795 [Mycobacterium sp. CVI_P3]|uniref:Transmembrane protein n=1 Tax=Mycobacterium pinniadriaticum TaxID=2994102 RepID=A0ABT3SI56_9MYCO|nr:hypothetical protein [Mycobacterium pinniadriaticum]MCX2932715.1 hypothetical protein [Mycobacterium pinniadriaticum]MCX2939225.1 hypothetical protein [Mycobacterium pinniadriaticum]
MNAYADVSSELIAHGSANYHPAGRHVPHVGHGAFSTHSLPEPATMPIPLLAEAPITEPPPRLVVQPSVTPASLFQQLTQKRSIPSWVLVVLVAVTCALSAAPMLASTAFVIAEGAPTAYLSLMPIWTLMIALTTDRSHRRHDVSDSDVDRILATLIAAVAITSCQLIVGRIGAVGEFWHAHLVSVIAWVVALSILKFGSRSAARIRVAWGFLALCFPPFFLLAGQALGGSLMAYGVMTALYGAIAMFLTLRETPVKWLVTPAFFALASTGTYLLHDAPVPVAYLAPSAALTGLTVALFVRAPRHHGGAVVPKHSLLTVAIVVALAAIVGALPQHRVNYTPRADLISVRANWIKQLDEARLSVGLPQVFAWGPRVMGEQGSVVRYRLVSGKNVVFLDIFSTHDYGRLTEYCCGLWYATAPPPDIQRPFTSTGSSITQTAQMGNQYSPPEKPGDPSWMAHQWLWRYQSASGPVYQAVYLIASRDEKAPENVATPSPPNIRSGILAPLAALLQDHAALHHPTQYDSKTLDAVSRQIIKTAQVRPA